MSTNTVRKRLHVSGLTPAITPDEINTRLQAFGNVLALDGFNALDGFGQPRKFAYVTLEATESNLARCLNVLSGTTWKGTKLRIGEAKPDYLQRLELERCVAAEVAAARPCKRRRLLRGVQGIHAKDMSLVDVHNVDKRPGWYKTPLLHLIRPMKMRPSRPLPSLALSTIPKEKRVKSRNPRKHQLSLHFDAPTRPRVIDPRLYGSTHVCGSMLHTVVLGSPEPPPPTPPPSSSDDENSSPTTAPDLNFSSIRKSVSQAPQDDSFIIPDVDEEARRDLSLLRSMFGDEDNVWGDKESVTSDMDIREAETKGGETDSDGDEDTPRVAEMKHPYTATDGKNPQPRSLQDMFKPHKEAGFSLLSGLGEIEIDPSFDLDLIAPAATPANAIASLPVMQDEIFTESFTPSRSFSIETTLPFFFPQPDNPRAKDLFSIARGEGWEFGRSGDADSIRQRWEDVKGPLTKQWKKRSREAVKARRRRHGAADGEEA